MPSLDLAPFYHAGACVGNAEASSGSSWPRAISGSLQLHLGLSPDCEPLMSLVTGEHAAEIDIELARSVLTEAIASVYLGHCARNSILVPGRLRAPFRRIRLRYRIYGGVVRNCAGRMGNPHMMELRRGGDRDI
jgi:hypothetical protein